MNRRGCLKTLALLPFVGFFLPQQSEWVHVLCVDGQWYLDGKESERPAWFDDMYNISPSQLKGGTLSAWVKDERVVA